MRFQAIYLVYRWIIAIYFLAWNIATGVYSDSPKYFTFLTIWGFTTYNTFLLVAALSTMISYLSDYKEGEHKFSRKDDFTIKKLSGCCGYQDNKLSWYQMIHWFLFTIGNELAFVILLLFWTMLYRGGPVDRFSANVHLVNGLVAVIDFWVSGIPVNLLHFVYLMIYGMVYIVFTGIYFAVSNEVVYPVLDYENRIGTAIAVVLCTIFIILPLIHVLFFYGMYLAKSAIMRCCFKRRQLYEDEDYRPVDDKEVAHYGTG